MFSMHQKDTIDLGEGATVVVRGLNAAEMAELGDSAGKSGAAQMEKALVGVLELRGVRRYKEGVDPNAVPEAERTDAWIAANSEEVPSEEAATAEWIMNNLPMRIADTIGKAVMKLSRITPDEKKG